MALSAGRPRDTLLKYDDPIESIVAEDKFDQKALQKGLPSIPSSHPL